MGHGAIAGRTTTRVARGHIPGAPHKEPWKPPRWEVADAAAIQAVALGRASQDQQRRAMTFIIHNLCGTYDVSYRPGSSEDTIFAEGKRFVGLECVKFINLNLSKLRNKPAEEGQDPPTEQPQ
jgi:hypothetical protein